jgi:hypothetical protein
MPDWSLADVERAIRASWGVDSCDDHDVADWSTANPARGQCTATAFVVQDLLGGELLSAEVLNADGSRQGWHYWNRLPDGREVDLTREQFTPDETIQAPTVMPRLTDEPAPGGAQYRTLSARVLADLGGAS